MKATEHQAEAERLLTEAKTASTRLTEAGPLPVHDYDVSLRLIEASIAMAGVHARLARR